MSDHSFSRIMTKEDIKGYKPGHVEDTYLQSCSFGGRNETRLPAHDLNKALSKTPYYFVFATKNNHGLHSDQNNTKKQRRLKQKRRQEPKTQIP